MLAINLMLHKNLLLAFLCCVIHFCTCNHVRSQTLARVQGSGSETSPYYIIYAQTMAVGAAIWYVWWPRSALLRRVRSGTAHIPHCVRIVSAMFPQSFRTISATSTDLQLSPRTVSEVFRSLSAPFPQPLRIVSAVLGSFLQVLAIDHR